MSITTQYYKITKAFVDKLLIPDRNNDKNTYKIYRDDKLSGFAVRVTSLGSKPNSGGVKSFVVHFGQSGRKTLGQYGDLTVEQARKEAKKILGQVASGVDPIAEQKASRARIVTLQEAFDDYLDTRKTLKDSTVHDYKRVMNEGLSTWKNKAMVKITKDMVQRQHQKLGTKSKARANNTMRVLRAIFNHAINKYEDSHGNPIIKVNPVNRLSQNRAWYKDTRRNNFIRPDDLNSWYKAVMDLKNNLSRDYILCLIFTGLRRNEAAALKWSDIDFNNKLLTVMDTKNGEDHTLPLPTYLLELFKARYSDIDSDNKRALKWVFPSSGKSGHLVEPKKAVKIVTESSGVKFTSHDLRRTFITIAESLDFSSYALKRLLNHKMGADVTAGYIINDDVERLREPMELISLKILSYAGVNSKDE